jgi:hypothetical protein
MKHTAEFPFANALPDAPLDMPKQRLEYRRSLLTMLRDTLSAFAGR